MSDSGPYTLEEVQVATSDLNWTDALDAANGFNVAAVLLLDQPVAVKKVASEYNDAENLPVYVVIQIGEQLFKKNGSYESHYGTRWNAPLVEVKAVERTVTLYEKVPQLPQSFTRRKW